MRLFICQKRNPRSRARKLNFWLSVAVRRVGTGSPIYLAAVLENLSAEDLNLSSEGWGIFSRVSTLTVNFYVFLYANVDLLLKLMNFICKSVDP